jgi:DNA transposition AAA+ family ATPase
VPADIVATSVWKYLLSRMNAVHGRRAMGAFAGPPGIGKSTSIASFVAEHPGRVAVVRVRQPSAKAILVQQHMLDAIRAASGSPYYHAPSDKRGLERAVDGALADWSGRAWSACGGGEELQPRLTIVFDEAQTLAPISIEMLRFWNDGVGDVYPIGMVFVGNHEFRIDDSDGQASFLSAAVASRTPYRKTFSYADLSDDDLSLFIEAKGDVQPDALALLLAHCRSRRTNRDLRRLDRELGDLVAEAGGGPITAANVKISLGLE